MVIRRGRRRRALRRGLASLEAVIATGISVPAAITLFYMGRQACRFLFEVIGTLVGWPYL